MALYITIAIVCSLGLGLFVGLLIGWNNGYNACKRIWDHVEDNLREYKTNGK